MQSYNLIFSMHKRYLLVSTCVWGGGGVGGGIERLMLLLAYYHVTLRDFHLSYLILS